MKGLVGMAAGRYGGIFAEAARSAAGFTVSTDAQVALVRVLGRPTAVMYRSDAGESRRRRETGLVAITRMDLLDLLLSLPCEWPVPCRSLTGRERRLLRSLPAGSIEIGNGTVIRRAVVPLTVELAAVRAGWGGRSYFEALARKWAPEVADDDSFRDWFVWHMRRSLSPGAALTAFRTAMELDVSDVVSAVRVPTLVIPLPSLPGPGHYLASRIRGAEIVELPELSGLYTWVDDDAHGATMEATATFISRLEKRDRSERVLATILFTDIVGSTELASRLGDSAWRDLLESHHAIVRRELARFQGRELDTVGDGFFAAFDGPARAVLAASAIRDSLRTLELEIRAGLHTGECEVSDGKIAGIAVSIGARISSLAAPGEVLVSSTVKDLVAGSGLQFEDRGEHHLKGVPEAWRLFAAAR